MGGAPQVFDKALSEPGFSEIYATLCHDLNQSLPTFKDESNEENAQEITFRRVLLNKCQEEFEEGDAAMKAVEAREKAEQERADAKVRLISLQRLKQLFVQSQGVGGQGTVSFSFGRYSVMLPQFFRGICYTHRPQGRRKRRKRRKMVRSQRRIGCRRKEMIMRLHS